jgi:hypothetical protein
MNTLQHQASSWSQMFLRAACLLPLILVQPSYADFVNGNFEDPYTPDSTTCSPITGWTSAGYYFNGTGSASPTSISAINLQATGGTNIQFCGVTDVIVGATPQSVYDYFLEGAGIPVSASPLMLPEAGLQSGMINLRPYEAGPPTTQTKVGTSHPVSGWANIASQATSLSQQITVQASDIDPSDGKVHIRFVAAPVVENPNHTAVQQPFLAVQLNNITTGRTGANPVFFQWNYGGQPGVPWTAVTSAGTNPGSFTDYEYTNLQAFDISPGNAFIHVGDVIELVVLAAGCSPGGHDGHVYLDEVGIAIPPGLWVSATGPTSSTPGNNITYTYTYTNTELVAESGVIVTANLPLPAVASSPASTTFVSVTTPTAGTSPSCSGTGPVTCTIGTLQPGQTGTFQLTVNIPSAWATSDGPVNNGDYPIVGTNFDPLLGPLVQTALVAPSGLSNLVVNASGLPPTGTVGTPYSGTFTCSNTPTASATGDAPSASCDITNLPAGLSESGCTISPSNTVWTEPTDIPSTQTVTCSVTGTPTTTGAVTATVATNAANNSNSTTNQVNATITIGAGQFTVTSSGDGYESFTPNTPQTVNPGSTQTFTVTPNAGFVLSSTVGGSCPAGTWSGNQYTTGIITGSCSVMFTAQPMIPATLNGSPVLSPAVICCGRPLILGPLATPGSGPTSYVITGHTGSVTCQIGQTASQTYLKMYGSPGSCTIVGTKNGISSAPFTVKTP